MRELRVIVCSDVRDHRRLDKIPLSTQSVTPPIKAISHEITRAHSEGSLWLYGGEPTLRSDLPELVREVATLRGRVGLHTDGLALASPQAVVPLQDVGLSAVRIELPCGRSDAGDWLLGAKGATKRIIRAIRTCVAADLHVSVDIVVTRPTMPHLAETVLLTRKLGVRSVHLRRLRLHDCHPDHGLALSPRFAILGRHLEAAAAQATDNVPVWLHDFPRCVCGAARDRCVPSNSIQWLMPAGTEPAQPMRELQTATGMGCHNCSGPPKCAGAPLDYTNRFGRDELRGPAAVRLAENSANETTTMALANGVVHTQFGVFDDDGKPRFAATRDVRRRLVRIARSGARALRITSPSLSHPNAPALIREGLGLGFDRVSIAADGTALAAMTDADFFQLRQLHRVDIALHGPDAVRHDARTGQPGSFDAAIAGLRRFHKATGVDVGAYAVLAMTAGHGGSDDSILATDLTDYAVAWERGDLPGVPAFRLGPVGTALSALIPWLQKTALGSASRNALVALLPSCLIDRLATGGADVAMPQVGAGFRDELEPVMEPAGDDRCGTFTPCPGARQCDAHLRETCPGVARGWTLK